MAVYAAHLTRTLQGTPSVFQISAQEALGATVKPALRKLVEFLADLYPNRCGWCERWYDELYLLLDGTLQYHYLKHYAASFSECFYGLFRVPIHPSTEFSSVRLPVDLERGSLVLLVLLPYLRDKLEKYVDQWREDLEDGRLGKSKSDQARKAAIRLYSIVHFISETSKLIVLARYLTGKGPSPLLSLQVLGLTLRDAPLEEPDETWSDFFRSIAVGQFGSAVLTFPMLWRLCSAAAQHGTLVLQLLRWWHHHAPRHAAHLPPPPAPAKDERSAQYMNLCPLCRQPWRVPTVLPVSGFVFCYACVSRHVRARGACPVSRLRARAADLRRLYVHA